MGESEFRVGQFYKKEFKTQKLFSRKIKQFFFVAALCS
jgi:hypothetical protein